MIILGLKYESKKVNPIIVMYTLWGVVLFLSSIRLFDLREVENKTYYIILIGLISYAIGTYFCKLILANKLKSYISNQLKNEHKYVLRYKLMYLVGLIIIIVYIYDLSKTYTYLLNGNSLSYIRSLAQDSNSLINANRSQIENAIRILIVTPGAIALQPIVATDFWLGKKDKKLIIINLFIIVLRLITDGSRSLVTLFLIHFILLFIFCGKKIINKSYKIKIYNSINSRRKKTTIFLMIIVFLIILYKSTISRSGENALRFVYYYLSMEPYMFQVWSQIVDATDLIAYGVASTNGFWFVFFYLTKNILTFLDYPQFWSEINNFIMLTDSQWQIIAANGVQANAYVSLFWFLYLDGRLLGITLGMFIYGVVCYKVYDKAINLINIKNMCFYLIILQGLIFSFVRFQFADIYYAIVVLFILILGYKKQIE
jgi:oligosaccharide repeat unit polymerase